MTDAWADLNNIRIELGELRQSIADLRAELEKMRAKGKRKKSDLGLQTQALTKAYCDAFHARWHVWPEITKASAGILERAIRDFGAERAGEYLSIYMSKSDAWIVQSKHDLKVFSNRIHAIAAEAKGAAAHNGVQAREQERKDANADVVREFARGEG